MRIEGASGTPKKGFKIEKVKIHGVGPLSKLQFEDSINSLSQGSFSGQS